MQQPPQVDDLFADAEGNLFDAAPVIVEEEEDDAYHRRGDYYQCVKCDKFTVHRSNDRICINRNCVTNIRRSANLRGSRGLLHLNNTEASPLTQANKTNLPARASAQFRNTGNASSLNCKRCGKKMSLVERYSGSSSSAGTCDRCLRQYGNNVVGSATERNSFARAALHKHNYSNNQAGSSGLNSSRLGHRSSLI